MKKFVFTLEKVLVFKNQTLEVLKNELSRLQRESQLLENKIKNLQDVFKNKNGELVSSMQDGVAVNEIGIYKIYLSNVNADIKKVTAKKHDINLAIAKKQTEVISMNIEIASLEKLKEKQYQDYKKIAQDAAEIELNEFINNLSSTA